MFAARRLLIPTPMNWRALGVLVLLARTASADIVTLKNGREIEGLVVDMDEERLVVRRAGEGITQNWQLMRSEISSVRLSPPDLAGFRTVARRLEADRALGDAAD